MQALTEDVVLVQVRATKWSGTRQVPKNDPNLRVDNPPPEQVWRSWGSKAIFDQDELKIFDAIEKDADRTMLSVGTRFLLPRQYVIHADQTAMVEQKLQDCRRRHQAARDDLVSRYDTILESFIQSNRQWEAFIRASSMQPEHVATRFRFEYLIIPVEGGAVQVIGEQVPVLAAGILGEVETIGKELVRSLTGRDTMTRRGLGPFKRIRDKLDALSFVDTRFQPIIDSIDDWVDRIGKTGPIDGRLFSEGYGLALLLGDAERMARHGGGQIAAREAPSAPDEDATLPSVASPETLSSECSQSAIDTVSTEEDEVPQEDASAESATGNEPAQTHASPADTEPADDDLQSELDAIFGGALDDDAPQEDAPQEDAEQFPPPTRALEQRNVQDDGWF